MKQDKGKQDRDELEIRMGTERRAGFQVREHKKAHRIHADT